MIKAEESIEGVINKVRQVARLLGLEERGEVVVASIQADAAELDKLSSSRAILRISLSITSHSRSNATDYPQLPPEMLEY